MANIGIHEFHIKLRWLFGLASRSDRSQLPGDFPKFCLWKEVAAALGVSESRLGNWCPPVSEDRRNPLKARAEKSSVDRPPVAVARDVARIFGFAPPGGVDSDAVWRDWWTTCWPEFTPSETRQKTAAPAAAFKERYLRALDAGELKFQPLIRTPTGRAARAAPATTPTRPTLRQAAQLPALIERFATELDTRPTLGNVKHLILSLLQRISDLLRELPDPSLWAEAHLEQLLNVQDLLIDTFHSGDADAGEDSINYGQLAPLLQALRALAGKSSDAHKVVVDNEFAHYLDEARAAIKAQDPAGMPMAARLDVSVLDDQLEVAEYTRRIDLQQVNRKAGRIRSHRIGALHGIERLVEVLIGKRTARAPDFAIFRDEFPDGGEGPQLVVIPATDRFLMGSAEGEAEAYPDEIAKGQGKRPMRIARRFALGRHPVTREEYEAFVAAAPGARRPGGNEAEDRPDRGRHPATHVSWDDAQAYCDWLNRSTGLDAATGYRLPSEAEWEYACRAGMQTRRWWGDEWDPARANGNHSFEGGATSPVDHYPPNPRGLCDMIGNVLEWCADRYTENISDLPPDGAAYTGLGDFDPSFRVLRGGSWNSNPQGLRSALRGRNGPDDRYDLVGFRVARTL